MEMLRESVTVPAGTKIPLTLKQGITTKNAQVGDPVYAQTSFPIAINNHIVDSGRDLCGRRGPAGATAWPGEGPRPRC